MADNMRCHNLSILAAVMIGVAADIEIGLRVIWS
jgi:hypothetical protein